MGPLRPALVLFALCLLGAAVRVYAVFAHGPLHPDEFFQYLEPAYVHLTGVGIDAWEFRDGLRSWVLPFYNGAWIAAFMAVGVKRGETLVHLVQVQTALLNASVVWFAFRGGANVARKLSAGAADGGEDGFWGGLFAAFMCAFFPYFVVHAGHTLSELPSLLALFAGLVEIAELREEERPETRATIKKAALAGLLLSLSACLRIANGPLVLIAPLWLLLTGRFRALLALVLAALLPVLLFGLVDKLTWGEFAHSYVAYIRFNFIEGKAANFGTAPWWQYGESLWRRSLVAGPLLLLVALFGLRHNFVFMVPLLSGVLYLSMQAHKEDRFVLFVWPLLFTGAGGVLGALFARARAAGTLFDSRASVRAALNVVGAVLAFGLVLATPLEGALYMKDITWLGEGRFLAETVVGDDPRMTGLLIDGPIFGGGALWIGRRAPHLDVDPGLLPNPLITHVIVESDSRTRAHATAQGFKFVREINGMVIMRRPLRVQR